MTNPLFDCDRLGTSVWYDNISRELLRNGGLQRLVDDFGVLGLTSNPTIFDHAISGSDIYDEAIGAETQTDAEAIFFDLAIADIQAAADVLAPIYARTGGGDGFVSLEVSPRLANDTDATTAQAAEVHGRVDRANLMVKIPGTLEGLPAITATIGAGINVNVTLLFAIERHMAAADAYLAGLEAARAAGHDLSKIHSVASFFVSRVDTLVDKQLGEIGSPAAQALCGKAAVANAKLAYQAFKAKFAGERWESLAADGATLQRPLWASTSTKNPDYPDTLYVADLIGPHTVNTMPQATVDAFADHGVAAVTIEDGVDDAKKLFDDLAAVGIDMDAVTAQLEREGVASFVKSYEDLLATISAKQEKLRGA